VLLVSRIEPQFLSCPARNYPPYVPLDGNTRGCVSHLTPIIQRCSYFPPPVCTSINTSDPPSIKRRTPHQTSFSGFRNTALKTNYTAMRTFHGTHSRPTLSIAVSRASLYSIGRINCKDAKWPFENTPERINTTKGEHVCYFGCIQGIHKRMVQFQVNKKFISHLTRAQRTPSAAATVQVSRALPAVRFSCLLRGRGASFQDGVAAGKGFLCAPF
jgi:hypothetical protein